MKKTYLIGAAAVAMASVSLPVLALDVDFTGRSRFNVTAGETLGTVSALYAATGAATSQAAATTLLLAGGLVNDADIAFSNDERLDVNVSGGYSCCVSYGGMLRIEDSGVSSDIYLSNSWGRVDLGNIDNARGGAYDTSIFSVGPLSPGSSVGAINLDSTVNTEDRALAAFDGSSYSGTGIVYTAPSIAGMVVKLGFDGNNIEGSVAGKFKVPALNLPLLNSLGRIPTISYRLSADDGGRYGGMLTTSIAGFNVAGFAGEDDDNDSYMGAAVSSTFGRFDVSLATSVANGDDVVNLGAGGVVNLDASKTDTVLGAAMSLAPGLTASASVMTSSTTLSLNNVNAGMDASATRMQGRLQLTF